MIELTQEELQAKGKAKSIVVDLVRQFKEDIVDTGRIKTYNEESVKVQFITPLFEALGWNTSDQNEVFYETNIKGKRSDYLFKLNNKEVFIVEAKKPAVSLKIGTTQGDLAAKQAINYAWHKNINFAILTDFEEIRVFHALERPRTVARNLAKHKDFGMISLEYDKFEEEFDKLWLLSRWSVESGALDACLSEKDIRIRRTVDKEILDDLLKIREWLVKDIKKRNANLSTDTIGELVQKWINRLIFIRTTEDRGLEKESLLLNLASDAKFQKLGRHLKLELLHVFRDFDKKYNSKLFAHIDLDDNILVIDQDVLVKVIYALYFGAGKDRFDRYDFALIPSDLLGRIYEQYLGVILKTTEKRAKLEAKKSKRKKMGIYYTPAYIVDYIVRNTIGEALKGKTLEEISKFKIVDPATGSGSFLLRAFDEVCKFVKERIDAGDSYDLFSKEHLSKDSTLSLGQKIKILRNNIYGVDLDQQALEICKLSLLLKLLENEGPDTKKRVLPVLEDNLQCGNSLIDDESIAGDKAFKWRYRFKDVFKQGGFDVVIGNPPYIRNTELTMQDKKHFNAVYTSAYKQSDILVFFYERGINILKNHAALGYITSNKFLASDYGKKLRELMLKNCAIKSLIDVSHLRIFKEALTYPVITILKKEELAKSRNENPVLFKQVRSESFSTDFKVIRVKQSDLLKGNDAKFISHKGTIEYSVLEKIDKTSIKIEELFASKRGSPKNKIKIIEKKTDKSLCCVISKNVKPYFFKVSKDLFVISDLQNKVLNREKILIPRTVLNLRASYDSGGIFIMDRIYYLVPRENVEIDLKFVVLLLNSKLLDFYYKLKFGTTHVSGGYLDLRGTQIIKLPIAKATPTQQQELAKLADRMLELNKRLQDAKTEHEKEQIKRQIASTDSEIDDKVYKLYGLTKEEIEIIENG